MNNKEIIVESLLTRRDTQVSVLDVMVLEDLGGGISQQLGKYKLTLEGVYTDPSDPALLAIIAEKLAGVLSGV